MIIAITGTPGTGKTDVGRIVAKRLGYRFISLNKLAKEKKLYCGFDRKRHSRIVDIEKISIVIEKITDAVIESHYSQNMPSDLIVVLRCNAGELRKRLSAKGWPKKKIEENVEAEIMEVCLSGALESGKKVIVIETAKKTADKCAREILRKINKPSG